MLVFRHHKDLPGINQVRITDLTSIRAKNNRIAASIAIFGAADAPQAVAANDRAGQNFGYNEPAGFEAVVEGSCFCS